MKIIKTNWFNDADSPVVLMVDDLDNLWFDLNKNGYLDIGEDWGYWRDLPNSSFTFLKKNLLNKFPEIKVTFFSVVGNPVICEYKCGKVYRGSINQHYKVAEFFNRIHHSPNFEIAYHGLTHGVMKNDKYIPEWLSYNSTEEALKRINEGQKICKKVFGEQLKGGKYPCCASNIYSDESVDKAGFLWWCRSWTKDNKLREDYATLEMKTFGKSDVVDFPSTVNPSVLTRNPIKRMAQFIFKNPYHRLERYFEELLQNKIVISIQEHAGVIKANGIRQTPNIIDDMPVLQHIYSFLREKNVWYATCSEIANYYIAFTTTNVEAVDNSSFELKYTGKIEKPWLTLLIDRAYPAEVISPSGRRYKSVKSLRKDKQNLVNIEVENGYYQIK